MWEPVSGWEGWDLLYMFGCTLRRCFQPAAPAFVYFFRKRSERICSILGTGCCPSGHVGQPWAMKRNPVIYYGLVIPIYPTTPGVPMVYHNPLQEPIHTNPQGYRSHRYRRSLSSVGNVDTDLDRYCILPMDTKKKHQKTIQTHEFYSNSTVYIYGLQEMIMISV